ncbi:MAG: ATP-dependent helicase [Chitinispirillaceae bacterium]
MKSDCADLLDGLNEEQHRAVTVPNSGAVLVLAGAGCGKTAVLTRRIVYLIRLGIKPCRICALTFSRKAATEMAHRLSSLDPACCGGPAPPLVTTFHSFSLRALCEYMHGVTNFRRIGFRGEVKLLSNRQRLELLAQSSTTEQRKALMMSLTELDSTLSQLTVFPEKVKEKFTGSELNLLSSIESRSSQARKGNGFWDFSDLIKGALELFRKHTGIAQAYSRRFDAILVDEFQDTNPMQIEMLDILLSSGASLYAVGDDDQAIYGFRGADIRPIRNFSSRFKDSQIVKLQMNYRSIPVILDCANRLWLDKPQEYRKTLVSGLNPPPKGCRKPVLMRFRKQDQMMEWVLGKARFIQRREKIDIASMAMLFRINHSREWVAGEYKKSGLDPALLPQMLTVHASKGLEYPVVFLCDLEEGVFPHYKLPKKNPVKSWTDLLVRLARPRAKVVGEGDFEEELRLFYVGVTRAQRFLFFVTVGEKSFYGRVMSFRPSRFLDLVK